ncbi:hypothetical protein C8F01DRAFT_1229633 [Mycena amicta]|nr:hypothetical protein C8F01DRAFT_1229633 [Mycena amicta]
MVRPLNSQLANLGSDEYRLALVPMMRHHIRSPPVHLRSIQPQETTKPRRRRNVRVPDSSSESSNFEEQDIKRARTDAEGEEEHEQRAPQQSGRIAKAAAACGKWIKNSLGKLNLNKSTCDLTWSKEDVEVKTERQSPVEQRPHLVLGVIIPLRKIHRNCVSKGGMVVAELYMWQSCNQRLWRQFFSATLESMSATAIKDKPLTWTLETAPVGFYKLVERSLDFSRALRMPVDYTGRFCGSVNGLGSEYEDARARTTPISTSAASQTSSDNPQFSYAAGEHNPRARRVSGTSHDPDVTSHHTRPSLSPPSSAASSPTTTLALLATFPTSSYTHSTLQSGQQLRTMVSSPL